MAMEDAEYAEEFVINSRGQKLFTCSWAPTRQEPKALIFICHGYAMECSITMNSSAIRLVKAGYAIYGIDYEGHGKSSGLQGYITSFDDVVDDCSNHFSTICSRKENKNKMRYLLGESMGGAVALLLHRKNPDFWDGAVLVAPMCKISNNMKPNPLAVSILTRLCKLIPTWRVIPTEDIIELAFKRPEIRRQVRENEYCYKGRLRLKTGHELLRISSDLEHRLTEVSLPFLVLHGEEDRVTDKSGSLELYENASSKDKTLKMYRAMWHGLLYGETEENIERVFSDIVGWLEERSVGENLRLERELKSRNDEQMKDLKTRVNLDD